MAKVNKRFQDYIDDKNRWNKFTGGTDIVFPLTQDDVEYLVGHLGSDLSPENLHCDGEISAKQAGVKYRKLMGVHKDLTAYAKKNGLTVPELMY